MALISPFLPPGTMNSIPQPVLTADTVTLRPWTAGDAPVVFAAHQDPAIAFWHRRRIEDLDDALPVVEQWLGQWEKESGASWAICDQRGLVVGRAALSRINLFEGDGEIGCPPACGWLARYASSCCREHHGGELISRWADRSGRIGVRSRAAGAAGWRRSSAVESFGARRSIRGIPATDWDSSIRRGASWTAPRVPAPAR